MLGGPKWRHSNGDLLCRTRMIPGECWPSWRADYSSGVIAETLPFIRSYRCSEGSRAATCRASNDMSPRALSQSPREPPRPHRHQDSYSTANQGLDGVCAGERGRGKGLALSAYEGSKQ